MKFYLAGPFFKPEQITTLNQIEFECDHIGLEYFSPRIECMCPPDAPLKKRMETFDMNCQGILLSSFVLARIDDFDPGTIWEIGYAFAKNVPVYAFTTVPGRGLNLMLSQSCNGFLQGMDSVCRFLNDMYNHNDDREALAWKENII